MSLAALKKPKRKYNSKEPRSGLVQILADMLKSALEAESSPADQGFVHEKKFAQTDVVPYIPSQPGQKRNNRQESNSVGNQQKWDTFVKERSRGCGSVVGLPAQVVVALAAG